jgi:excisionase family DNA binding protein
MVTHAVALSSHGRIDPLLSVNEVATYLGVTRRTVYRFVQDGNLRPVRVGERLRFRTEEVERYLAENTERAP